MTPDSLATTNIWLGIIAGVSAINLLVAITAAYFCLRLYRDAMTSIRAIETRHIEPLSAEVRVVLSDTRDVLHRIQNADDAVRHAIERVDGVAGLALGVLRARALPLWGAWRGLRAGLTALKKPLHTIDAPSIRRNPRAL